MLEKSFLIPTGAIRFERNLGTAAQVYSAQNQYPAIFIYKMTFTQIDHGMNYTQSQQNEG